MALRFPQLISPVKDEIDVGRWKVLQKFHIAGEVVFQQLIAYENYHGTAHVDEIFEAIFVGENRVPEAQDVGQGKFLAQHQRQPPEAVILREDALVLQPVEHVHVFLLQQPRQLVHHSADPVLRLVQRFDEKVSDLAHQRGEAPEAVGLSKLSVLVIRREDVVDGPDDLVHALYVALARVQLRVDEQHPLHHLPVRLFALLHRRVVFCGAFQNQVYLFGEECERALAFIIRTSMSPTHLLSFINRLLLVKRR